MEVGLTPGDLDRFQRSLERCLADATFASRFYARFLLANEEIAEKFANTDLKTQGTVLKRSLYLVMRAAHGLEDGLDHLERIAESHSHRKLAIPAHHYGIWLDTLILVMRETEPAYEDGLEELWRAVFQPCIDRMVGASGS
ncbi:MAG: globin [Sandaracinaceae bacterium]|nr:globin [Sandaracinaceae bacterium]